MTVNASSGGTSGSGLSCFFCRQFVPTGTYHFCSGQSAHLAALAARIIESVEELRAEIAQLAEQMKAFTATLAEDG